MTAPTLTQDDLLYFIRAVRWFTGRTLTQTDAAIELDALREKYDPERKDPPGPELDAEGFVIPRAVADLPAWTGTHDFETLP